LKGQALAMNVEGKRILVIDDEAVLLKLVEETFTRLGAQVYKASDGHEGLRQFYTCKPDLVILDLMLPQLTGWEVCQQIRQISNVPLILLTAINRDADIVRGLQCGADDYVTKPFSPAVLIARAQAALRRAVPDTEENPTGYYGDGYLTIDLEKRRILVNGKPVRLSATEYKLLAYLFKNAGRVVTFQQILAHVWGEEYHGNADYVHVYISHLRRKLEADTTNPIYIRTEHGVGYRFEKGLLHG
jgi:DNA-binding response OmpR family regulator